LFERGRIPACGRQALGMGDFNIFFAPQAHFIYRLTGWALLFAIAAKSKQKDLGKMIRHFIFPH